MRRRWPCGRQFQNSWVVSLALRVGPACCRRSSDYCMADPGASGYQELRRRVCRFADLPPKAAGLGELRWGRPGDAVTVRLPNLQKSGARNPGSSACAWCFGTTLLRPPIGPFLPVDPQVLRAIYVKSTRSHDRCDGFPPGVGFIVPRMELFDFGYLCPKRHGLCAPMDVKDRQLPNRTRGWQMKKLFLTGVALSALVAGPAMAADLAVRAPVYKAPPPMTGLLQLDRLLRRRPCRRPVGQKGMDQSRPIAAASGTSSAPTMPTAGSAVSRRAAIISSPAASSLVSRATMPGPTPRAANVDALRPALRIIRNQVAVDGHWPCRLCLGPFPGLREGRRRLGTRRIRRSRFPRATFATAGETRGGWTVGVGGEYAFTNYLSGFVEYNYYDFGTRDTHVRHSGLARSLSTSRRPRAS